MKARFLEKLVVFATLIAGQFLASAALAQSLSMLPDEEIISYGTDSLWGHLNRSSLTCAAYTCKFHGNIAAISNINASTTRPIEKTGRIYSPGELGWAQWENNCVSFVPRIEGSSVLSAKFDDYDAYADTIDRVQARFIMQKLEQRSWQIDGLVLPDGITVQHCWSGSGAIAQGVGQSGGVELAIPAAGDYIANGETVPLHGALWLSPTQEFLVSIPGIHRWFNVFVPESQASSFRLIEHVGGRRTGTCILGHRSGNTEPVSRLLMRFFANLVAMPEIAVSKSSLELFQAELLAAVEGAYGSPPEPIPKRPGRAPIVDRESILLAVDVIEASAEPAIPVPQLAEIAQVCDRSLRSGFQKYLGLSPTQYMQLRNLNRAWQRLSNSCPGEATVAGVAADLGIWDFGRFAMRYQRLFGELPSETLQRA